MQAKKKLGVVVSLLVLTMIGARCGVEESRPAEPTERATASAQDSVRTFWQHYRAATAFRQEGDFESAAVSYENALKQNDSHLDALYYFGNVSLELGRWETARQSWLRLIELDPGSIRGHSQLGNLALCRPEIPAFNPAAATEAFARADALNPGETGIALRLAELALINDDIDRASLLIDDVLGSDQTNEEAFYLDAFIAWHSGRFNQGLEELNERLSHVERRPEAPIAGEGDTRAGDAGPAYAAGAACPVIDTFVAEFESIPTPVDPSLAEEGFQRFHTLLESITASGR